MNKKQVKRADSRKMLSANKVLSKEWHPTLNGSLTPQQVAPYSLKKVWWICRQGHEWEAMISNRSQGSGCPYCSGRAATKDNCLAVTHPSLAREWHSTRNGVVTPRKVTAGSGKKVWWVCQQGHAWEALISNRSQGTGCPYCSGRAADDHSLATANPTLAGEWHPTRNGEVTPADVIPSSGRKVWWRCARGHEYQARVAIRNSQGTGCSYCSGRRAHPHHCLQTSCPPPWPGSGTLTRMAS